MFKQDLSSAAWTISPVGDLSEVPEAARRPIEARIPGVVHLDLIRVGIIKHPREGFAELDQFWVGKTDWRYECEFEAGESLFEHERIDLVCEGLDTIATVELNGVRIGDAANMFHPHRFDARAALRRGSNRLVITFKSPLRHIREEEARLGARPVNGDWDPYIFIRKQASNFGWDFAPKVPTSGIWKPIRLEAWSGVRIAGVRPRVYRARGDDWRVSVEADLEWGEGPTPGLLLGASLENHGLDAWASTVPERGRPATTISFDVENPRIWWPNGHGEQPLYHLKLSLHIDGEPHGTADGWAGNIGFREIRLHTEPDEHGSRFEFHVNGRPIFCKGANWVPEGLFAPEVTPETYRERVKQAADANMNMLRVWGGGYYETGDFYQTCDELGIMVWQDFMFACAMYPEEAPYPALVEAEARHQISRLSSHACLALWCGGNECIWAYESWGNAPGESPWKERLGDKTWGRGYYLELLPRLVSELDPTRSYWANSPWSGSEAVKTNGEKHGDRHTWDVRMEGYRAIVPRFCSEFGQQAPPWDFCVDDWSLGEAWISPAQMAHSQRATGGYEEHIDRLLRDWFPPTGGGNEWTHLAHLLQAHSLRLAIGWQRANRPRCMGSLIWQFNDAWSGASWSLIESSGFGRHALAAVKRAFEPRMLTIQPLGGKLVVVGINDTDEAWDERFRIMRRDVKGPLLSDMVFHDLKVPPHSVAMLADVEQSVGQPADPKGEYVLACTDAYGAKWYYVPPKDRAKYSWSDHDPDIE